MEAYYVAADLKAAAAAADGLALEKVRSSQRLTEGQAMDRSARHPDITYRLLEGHRGEGEGEYLFRVEIHPPDFHRIVKRSQLKVREREGGWKVTQFTDYEEK